MTNENTDNWPRVRGDDGNWYPAIPEPYYWGLLPFLWKRLTGWRDPYGRKAAFYNPLEIFK